MCAHNAFANVKEEQKIWQALEGAGTVKNVLHPPPLFLKTEDTRTDKNAPFVLFQLYSPSDAEGDTLIQSPHGGPRLVDGLGHFRL